MDPNDKTPIASAAFHDILRRDFRLLRAPACRACEVPKPQRTGDGASWLCGLQGCEFGCHRLLEWMVAQYCKQYRPRDLSDTLA